VSEDIMTKPQTLGSTPISRRMLLAGGVAAGSASMLAATNAHATVKVPKEAVKFSTVASNGHNCGSCKQFLAPSDCRFVKGPVAVDCSCWIWQSKSV
jgi:hypothetical protein